MDSVIKPQVLRIIMASALYWAWIFLLYWSPLLLGSGFVSLCTKGSAFFGSAFALGLWFLIVRAGRCALSNRLISRVAPYCLTPMAGLASLINMVVAPLSLPLLLTAWFATGFGAAFILVRISHLLFAEGQDNTSFVIFVMLFISCLIALFSSLLSTGSIAASLVMLVLPIASFLCVPVTKRALDIGDCSLGTPEKKRENAAETNEKGDITEAKSFEGKGTRRSFLISLIQMFLYSAVFSFALLTGLYSNGAGMSSMYIWFGAFLAGILMMMYSMWLHRYASADLVQLVLLGIAVIGLAPFSLADAVPDEARFASCVLLMFGFTSYDMLGLSRLLSVIAAEGVSFNRYFALGRFGNAFGVFSGWMLAALSLATTSLLQNQFISQVLPLVLIIMLVMLVMVCSYWGSYGSSSKARIDEEVSDRRGVWRSSCEGLCSDYGLSSRECEVFSLCAKGRDSAYICNALYISTHTVKSHIYHIYGKMGIHSQQELISLVEERANDIRADGRLAVDMKSNQNSAGSSASVS